MLLRFVASNFLSIADEIDFNMFPAPRLKTHPNHVYKTEQVDVLKAAAIYGANGSGKSNLIKGISLLDDLVVEGNISNQNEYHFKLDTELINSPTRLEIEFKIDNQYFSYGISFKNQVIYEEWLFELDNLNKGESTMIFERSFIDNKIKLVLHDDYIQSEKDKLRIELYEEEMLENSHLFIHFAHERNFSFTQKIYDWFDNLRFVLPESKFNVLGRFIHDNDFLNFMNDIFPKFDTGVHGIDLKKQRLRDFEGVEDYDEYESFKKMILQTFVKEDVEFLQLQQDDGLQNILIEKDEKDELWVRSCHTKHIDKSNNHILFEFHEESDGTRRLFDLVPIIDFLRNEEFIFVIDEIGRSIHPVILKELVEIIMSEETKGQIIFTTHESHLLDLDVFRSDEIWFTEKDKFGKTSIYPLSDYKPRYDLNIQKGYLNGRFGAIPFLGDLTQLKLEESHAEEK